MIDRWLNRVFDGLRPTLPNETRESHEHLVFVAIGLGTPIWTVIYYDFATHWRGVMQFASTLPGGMFLLLILVLCPLMGVFALLVWLNVRCVFDGAHLWFVNVFRRRLDMGNVVRATMAAPSGRPGDVDFHLVDGATVRATTEWRNVRAAYEALAAHGVPVEPWRTKA